MDDPWVVAGLRQMLVTSAAATASYTASWKVAGGRLEVFADSGADVVKSTWYSTQIPIENPAMTPILLACNSYRFCIETSWCPTHGTCSALDQTLLRFLWRIS